MASGPAAPAHLPGVFPAERTAVVSGAGTPRGIGRAVARRLASSGWDLALLDIEAAGVEDVATDLAAETGRTVRGLGVDVSSKEAGDAAFEEIDRELPPVLAEVNLAGIPSPHSLFELDEATYTRVMDVNATGTLFMMQAAARRMIDGGRGGRIVTTSSLTAYDGGGTFSKIGYAAAKAAVLGLTRGGARELGPYGITVNAVVPGPIDTDIMGGTLTEERKARMAADIPLGRVGRPHEVASLIAFLVSEDAGFVSGDAVLVDGAKHMV